MTQIELSELYKNDKSFKEYVDKYALCHRMFPEDTFTHKIVNAYAEYLKGGKR